MALRVSDWARMTGVERARQNSKANVFKRGKSPKSGFWFMRGKVPRGIYRRWLQERSENSEESPPLAGSDRCLLELP